MRSTFPGFRGPSCTDAFIAKINPSGTVLEFATYLGGAGNSDSIGYLSAAVEGWMYFAGSFAPFAAGFPERVGELCATARA